MATKKTRLYDNPNAILESLYAGATYRNAVTPTNIIGINQAMQQANAEFARNNNGTTLNSALTGKTYYRPYSNTSIPSNTGVSNVVQTPTIDTANTQDNLNYSNITNPEFSPINYTPTYGGNYDWDTGANMLSGFGAENPSTRQVLYNNEFSVDSTMSRANDVYNEYYAPRVQQQQAQNETTYQRNTNRAIDNVTNDRAAIQLQNQNARDVAAANTAYQQQQQIQAFQDTINARQLELNNKIQDYSNAWQEVSTYGYVVTENTANLLGIDPGQQLTTLQYKQIMSGIASNIAAAEASKVQLQQEQDNLNLKAKELEQNRIKYTYDIRNSQIQADSTIYNRLTDMLQRNATVTPAMVALGQQVGMSLTAGEPTSKYWTTAEELQNYQNVYGQDTASTVSQAKQAQTNAVISNNIQSLLSQVTGRVNTGIQNPQTFANWITPLLQSGMSADNIKKQLKKDKKDTAGTYSFGIFNGGNKDAIYSVIDKVYSMYVNGSFTNQ